MVGSIATATTSRDPGILDNLPQNLSFLTQRRDGVEARPKPGKSLSGVPFTTTPSVLQRRSHE